MKGVLVWTGWDRAHKSLLFSSENIYQSWEKFKETRDTWKEGKEGKLAIDPNTGGDA